MTCLRPMVHALKQGDLYHSVGSQGQRVSASNAELTVFAEDLSIVVENNLSGWNEGEQIEVYFESDRKVVRFVVNKGPRNSRFTDMVSEIPTEGDVKIFFDHFFKNKNTGENSK